jgi:hypothetical protein
MRTSPTNHLQLQFYGVNAETAALAPFESMQFGRTVHHLLQQISMANPRFGPVYMSKLDIAGGFYRIPLQVEDIPKLGIVFPKCPGEKQLVVFPLTLPMGWVHSPPFFTAATKTVADLANATINCCNTAPPHRLEAMAETAPKPLPVSPIPQDTISACTDVPARRPPTIMLRKPAATYNVYVDDFISLIQGGAKRRLAVQRNLFHSLDKVFRPLETGNNLHRQEPISVKKLLKGDAHWATTKTILG